MAVLTISRDIGSGGLELARRVAELADYRIADKALLEKVMREYGFVEFDRAYEKPAGLWSAEEELNERTFTFLDRVIRAVAKADRVVIVGRGGFAPLAGFADVVHVRATAPFALRVDRIMDEKGFGSRTEAIDYVEARDRARKKFVSRCYGLDRDNASLFDLSVNVDAFGVGPLADLLAECLRRIDAGPEREPSAARMNVDPVLSEVAERRLAEAGRTAGDD